MPDQAKVHIGENSPEEVAYKLLKDVAMVEKKVFHHQNGNGFTTADRAWILDTYAECLMAVKNPNLR